MSINPSSTIVTERVDGIPVLLAHLEQMGVPRWLDTHFPTHGNWEGLSLGWLATIWLVHVLSRADHRLNRVRVWVAHHLKTLRKCTGLPIEELDFTDDRLAAVLRYLNEDSEWESYEQAQGRHLLRVYELPGERVRLDSTTASTYQEATPEGLFQQGHSKDHRPDLAQVKVMLASLDPLGLPLATAVVDGSRADDPLYGPAIEQVRAVLDRQGVLYLGDSKMAAEATRALVQAGEDYYLMPLSANQVSAEELEAYLEPVWDSTQSLTAIDRERADGETVCIAEGYERTETLTVEFQGQTLTWEERRLVVRSLNHAAAQEAALRKRLAQAHAALAELTRRGRGKKRFTSLGELQQAVEAIRKQYRVEGLVEVHCTGTVIERPVRGYRDRPARVETEHHFQVAVTVNEGVLAQALRRLGWRIYATNAPADALELTEAVLAYRDQYIAERGFSRLKGQPLSLTPMYLQREDHVTGLIRLLSIALRALTLFEFEVRRRLKGTALAGLYPGNPKRTTSRPSAELLLEAFQNLDLIIFPARPGTLRHLTPLSEVQQRILALLDLPQTIYTRLAGHFS